MKDIMAQNAMLTYPQFNKLFIVHTDASKKQLGGVAVMTQAGRPPGFFSKKLTETQRKNY
jgi:hypothetical protein